MQLMNSIIPSPRSTHARVAVPHHGVELSANTQALIAKTRRSSEEFRRSMEESRRFRGEMQEVIRESKEMVAKLEEHIAAMKALMQSRYGQPHVFDMRNINYLREEMMSWLNEHHLEGSYMVYGCLVGIENPDAAFHFKLVWIG